MHVTDRVTLRADELRRDTVLQAFELLRRRVAVERTGAPGASAGFPSLRFHAIPQEAGTLVVRATLVDAGSRWQRVEYDATFRAATSTGTPETQLVARAVGQTCALPVAPAAVVPAPRVEAPDGALTR
ncbi:hypothetical protein [Nocardioides jejuensis]|uniref:Uncharacterized protein n=1 Tax=Nocardioides jejuensis TaxID=2502782 RepID=A0A4R1CK74_9ACTN|nr:hypothetical protein [Nocardioides jejuensis]TCJ30586.1 hypothetical protein EPD65_03200 [Nocardioides jejuensis]